MKNREIRVTVRNDLDKTSQAQLTIRSQPAAERWRRAIGQLGIFWGVAVLCILIPVLHFVLVPGFLIFGAAIFFRQLSFQHILEAGSLICPACEHRFTVKQAAFNWPRYDRCPECLCELILSED